MNLWKESAMKIPILVVMLVAVMLISIGLIFSVL